MSFLRDILYDTPVIKYLYSVRRTDTSTSTLNKISSLVVHQKCDQLKDMNRTGLKKNLLVRLLVWYSQN